MFTFFRGNADEVLRTLRDPYSRAYERLMTRRAHVDMSRWLSLSHLDDLVITAARTSGLALPSLGASLSKKGWVASGRSKHRCCIVIDDAWPAALAAVPDDAVASSAQIWSDALPAPVDQFTRGPLRKRALDLFSLCKQRHKDHQLLIAEEGSSELNLDVPVLAQPLSSLLGAELQFLAGAAPAIRAALADDDEVELQDAVKGAVDFSFHLSMSDIDALVAEVACLTGRPSARLAAGDEPATVVAVEWVKLWAQLPIDAVEPVGKAWVAGFGSRLSKADTDKLIAAVGQLAALCTRASNEGLDLVLQLAI